MIANDSAAFHSSGTWSACICTTTPDMTTRPAMGCLSRLKVTAAPVQSISIHPAAFKAVSIWSNKSWVSGSVVNATSNCFPANGFSFSEIRPCCSKVKILGALNLANSKEACAARSLASSACWFASAMFKRNPSALASASAAFVPASAIAASVSFELASSCFSISDARSPCVFSKASFLRFSPTLVRRGKEARD